LFRDKKGAVSQKNRHLWDGGVIFASSSLFFTSGVKSQAFAGVGSLAG
jgi:hypothetical protein